jgi:hypothetical protein
LSAALSLKAVCVKKRKDNDASSEDQFLHCNSPRQNIFKNVVNTIRLFSTRHLWSTQPVMGYRRMQSTADLGRPASCQWPQNQHRDRGHPCEQDKRSSQLHRALAVGCPDVALRLFQACMAGDGGGSTPGIGGRLPA